MRDAVAAQTVRIAAAVPMLVHAADGARRRFAESERARDLRAAIAAHFEQHPAAGWPLGGEHGKPPRTLEDVAVRFDVVEHVRDLLAQLAPVAHPDVALGLLVVAAEQLEH